MSAKCEWGNCDQTPHLQVPLCYYHLKVVAGLVDSAERPSARVMALIEEIQKGREDD